jgi:hypothetical protein
MKNFLIFTLGILFLLTGAFVYLTAREEMPYLLTFFDNNLIKISLPLIIKNSSPAFFHCAGMILISIPFTNQNKNSIYLVSLFWLITEILFEIGQRYDTYTAMIFDNYIFSSVHNYFLYGTFDYNDISAAIAGTLTAIFLYKISIKIKNIQVFERI